MGIKEIAKETTREEFEKELEKSSYGWGHCKKIPEHVTCPGDLELNEIDDSQCGNLSCKQCWLTAIEDVKFKGEEDMFSWEEFVNGKVTVHCNTEGKADNFLRECDKQNIKWADEKASSHSNYEYFKKDTCYSMIYGGLGYCDLDFYEKEGLKIIDWELVNVKEFTKIDLKDGMVVEYRDGNRRLVIQNRLISQENFSTLGMYMNNLTHHIYTSMDLVKVYKPKEIRGLVNMLSDKNLDLIWERKERKQVDFMTAVKAYSEGKKILCEINGLKYPYIPSDEVKSNMGYSLRDNKSGLPISTREILEGAWYIED